jgi:hypothetical protein
VDDATWKIHRFTKDGLDAFCSDCRVEINRRQWLDRVRYTKSLLALFETMSPKWRRVLADELLAESSQASMYSAIRQELADWIERYATVPK